MRALRAALFAAVCISLAAVGHSSMSGHDLPVTAVLFAFVLTAGAGWLAGTRRRGALTIGSGLLTVQGVLHLIFAGSEPHDSGGRGHHHTAATGADATSNGATTLDMAPTAGTAAADTLVAEATAHLTQLATGPGGMLAAHVLAAAVCALWLAHGEAALFRLARTAGTVRTSLFAPLRLVLAVVRVPELPYSVRPRPRTRRLHGVVLAHSVSRRGPPGRPYTRATVPGALV